MNRNSRFINYFKNEKGASSVLVIIMMVVLVILGLAIATTSISNRKLADKKTKWLISYYDLSGKAQVKIADIDSAINKAKKDADSNKSYASDLEYRLKDKDIKVAMPYEVNDMSSCNISFEIREVDSKFNKRLFVNIMVPLNIDNKGDSYQITNYQLLQEPLVKEEVDEFKENPFEHMN